MTPERQRELDLGDNLIREEVVALVEVLLSMRGCAKLDIPRMWQNINRSGGRDGDRYYSSLPMTMQDLSDTKES